MTKSIHILGGEAQLFKRDGSDNWYVSFSVPGQGQIKRSLKTTNLEKAKVIAKNKYVDALGRNKRGLSADGFFFEAVSDQFLQNFERKVSRGEKKTKDLKDLTGVVTRYFNPYFEGRLIDEIDTTDIEEYREWRKDYWLTGPGKEIKYIYYKRNGKELRRRPKGEVPSASRQHSELSMLRQLFKFAARKRFIDRRNMPEITSEPVKQAVGPGLTPEELEKILSLAYKRQRESQKHKSTWFSRMMLCQFVRIAAYTGLRPTELLSLRWRDLEPWNIGEEIQWFVKGPDGDRRLHSIGPDVIVDDLPELGELELAGDLKIHVRGKGKFGPAIAPPEAFTCFEILHNQWHNRFGELPEEHDPIFFNYAGEPIKSFKGGLAQLLNAAGLLYDREGRRRDAKTFRHYYITQKLVEGVPPYVVAINTRTSVKMIENTYSKAMPDMFADELRGKG